MEPKAFLERLRRFVLDLVGSEILIRRLVRPILCWNTRSG